VLLHGCATTREEKPMPTYRYRCSHCGGVFEHAEHVAEHERDDHRCPHCGSAFVQHLPTQFVARTSKKS
jgi:putative FmdB family regulatory protein